VNQSIWNGFLIEKLYTLFDLLQEESRSNDLVVLRVYAAFQFFLLYYLCNVMTQVWYEQSLGRCLFAAHRRSNKDAGYCRTDDYTGGEITIIKTIGIYCN